MPTPTESILEFFHQINAIPRCSKKEQEISKWLRNWGESRGYESEQDKAMNVLIRVPATPGMEAAPTVILQGHMDMVCDKTPESTHDFDKDPVLSRIDGEWLVTDGTTLGADNGIAVALALAAASAATIAHPPLELLVTVDEETGLNGAKELAADWLAGRILINLDSEDEGVFTVGCAGGRRTIITLQTPREAAPPDHLPARITVGGLQGGHSGGEIHLGRANANQLAVRALKIAMDELLARIVRVDGGSADNAIARDANAVIMVPDGRFDDLASAVSAFESIVQSEYRAVEPDLFVTCETDATITDDVAVLSHDAANTLVDLMLVMPHGVSRMSDDMPGLVETSTNFSTVKTRDATVEITTSQRSSSASQLEAMASKVEATARLSGATWEATEGYPGWKPQIDSPIARRAQQVYSELFGTDPKIDAVHGGLECGVIGAIYPEMEMISLGPTIRHPHSPQEKLHVPSLEKTWQLLVALIGSFSTR